MLPFRAFALKCILITQLRIEQIPLMFKHLCFALFIHEKRKKNKCLSSGLPFSWDTWRYFFPQESSFFQRPPGQWPFGTKVCIGTCGWALSWNVGEVSGGCSQTRSPLPHTCQPAGAAPHSSGCRRDYPMHKEPLQTIYKIPRHFYLPFPPNTAPKHLSNLTNRSEI